MPANPLNHTLSLLLGGLGLAVALSGCPTPAEEATGAALPVQGGQGGGPGGQGGGQAGGPGGPGGQGGGQGGGPGGQGGGAQPPADMILADVQAQRSQDDIKAGDHVTVAGTVGGACNGTVRIDAIEEVSAGPGATVGPLTNLDMESTGDFSLALPKGTAVTLAALCDDNKDGKIGSAPDSLSEPVKLDALTADKDGVTITLGTAMGGGGPGGGTPGGGQPGSGPPGSGGPGGGAPGGGAPGGGAPGGGAPGGGAPPAGGQ